MTCLDHEDCDGSPMMCLVRETELLDLYDVDMTVDPVDETLGTISAGCISIEYGTNWAELSITTGSVNPLKVSLTGQDLKDLAAISGIVSPIVSGELEL